MYNNFYIRTLLGIIFLFGNLTLSFAKDCDLQIQVVNPDIEMCGGEETLASLLKSRLTKVLNIDGVTAGDSYGQLYIKGKFEDLYKETLAGPPVQTVVKTSLTLMVADIFDNKVFDAESFELRGVGTTTQRAYINALNSLTSKNGKLEAFVERIHKKVINYFDKNYSTLLTKASVAAKRHDYKQALYYTSLIPECCVGYPKAEVALLSYYQQYIDNEGTKLVNKARAEFAKSPNADGAAIAFEYINMIDSESKAYSSGQNLAHEIEKQTKAEYHFEVHQKYSDAHNKELKLIDAARQVGVAYGSGQAPQTTNILWK